MNVHEYQAKSILKQHGVPIVPGVAILTKKEIDNTVDSLDFNLYVVKAQIHAGGRGKAGGVKVLNNKTDAKKAAHAMFGSTLITHQTGASGQQVQRIYIESGCDILKEYYFSCLLDRNNSRIVMIVSTEGGMDIEKVAASQPEKIIKIIIDPLIGMRSFHYRQILAGLAMQGDVATQMIKVTEAVYNAFIKINANQIEINPLVLTHNNSFVALDAKINIDDNALYKHPEIQAMRDDNESSALEVRADQAGLSYVKMSGNIGCMVNGAGLAMATMDIIKLYGAEPANFLDVGGGADRTKVTEAFNIILSDANVKGILVNIFGGIMRCDVIAEGLVAAAKDVALKVPLVVRLAGTNSELGKKILAESELSIITANDLGEAAKKIVAATTSE